MSQGLQHSPADIAQQVLIDTALAADPTVAPFGPWPVYSSSEPSIPDNCITVYHTVGLDDARLMATGEVMSHRGLQIRVRAVDAVVGHAKLDAIKVYLSEQVYQMSVTLDGIVYVVHAFTNFGDVLPIGKETPKSKRSLFTLNLTAPIRQVG